MRYFTSEQRLQPQQGTAIIAVLLTVGVLGTLSMGMLSMVGSNYRVNRQVKDNVGSKLLAEAGLTESVYRMTLGSDGGIGSKGQLEDMGTGGFWVETDDSAGGGLVTVTSTGVAGRSASRVEVVLQQGSSSFFSWGAFGEDSLTMESNAHVDSYDSSSGTYSDQAVNGSGSDTFANANGNVGSNSDITLSQNATVNGNAVPGPGGTTTISGTNAEVTGSTLPSTELQDMPEVDLPTTISSGPRTISGNSTVTMPSGDHAHDEFVVEGGSTLMIIGPATVVMESLELKSNADVFIDATNGPVEIFVIGDFVMNSNTHMGSLTQKPADLTLNLLSDNVIDPDIQIDLDNVDFESNAELFGTIYAPNARVEINSNFELFGAVIAREVHFGSWSRVHFDEALLSAGDSSGSNEFTRVSWRQLPVAASEIQW